MKKFGFIFIVLLLVSSISTTSVLAKTNNSTPKDAVIESHEAMIQVDSEAYAESVVDERYYDKSEAIEFYSEDFDFDPLVDYELLSEKQIDSDTYKFIVKKTFVSESIVKMPVTVYNFGGEWKVYISNDPLEFDETEVIEPSEPEYFEEKQQDGNQDQELSDSNIRPFAGTLWRSFSYNMKNNVSSSKFTKNPGSTGLILNISRQHLYDGGSIRYRVIASSAGGNLTIGDKRVSGNRTGYAISYSLNGKSYVNYQLRFDGNGYGNGGYYY